MCLQGHIRKRGDKWQAIIYLGTEGKKRKYHYKTLDTKTEAQRYRIEFIHQLNNNAIVDSKKISFGDYLKRWLNDYCLVNLKPRTYKRYEEIVKLHIIPDIGTIPLAKLQPLDIQHHYSNLLTKGRKGNKYKENKGLSPTTVLHHHKVIHKALEMAVKWQLVIRNVADAVTPPRKADVEFEVVDSDTILKILADIQRTHPVLAIPVALATLTGMRRGEVLGIRWKDLDMKTKRLSVKQQVYREVNKGIVPDSTKSDASRRSIKLPEFFIEVLKKHKAEQNKIRLSFGQAYHSGDLICCWEDGRPIDPDYMTKRFIKVARKYGPSIRLHDLRHSFATMLLTKKVHPKVVSEILGHSNIGITLDTYSHVIPSLQEEVANLVSEEFSGLDCQGIVMEQKKTFGKKPKAL
jgi:integrase